MSETWNAEQLAEFERRLDDKLKLPKTDDEWFHRLASMSAVEYDRARIVAAKRLEIRPSTLDKMVRALRPDSSNDSKLAGRPIVLREPDPWREPVDGAKLLDAMRTLVLRYAVLPTHADVVLALWALHTYGLGAFTHSPRLCATAPEKGCGKTLILDLMDVLALKPICSVSITSAALFRTVEMYQPTLLIDEAENLRSESGEDAMHVLNSGFQRSKANILRCVGNDLRPMQFSTWCPVAIALIGKLPPTLHDRSILIAMRRKTRIERVELFQSDRVIQDADPLRRAAARWAADYIEALRQAHPVMPDALLNRSADIWRPLLAIADLAGGDWPDLARKAAISMSGDRDEEGERIRLLADIRSIFTSREAQSLFSEDLVSDLAEMEDRKWAEWKNGKPMTKNQLARNLDPFGIKPESVWIGKDSKKGYQLSSFADAFARYLDSQNVKTSEPAPDVDLGPIAKRQNNNDLTFQKPPKPAPDAGSDVLTFWKGGTGE